MKELCIRCGQETPYDINFPVDQRLFYIDGSGQLCESCWKKLWLHARDVQKYMRYAQNNVQND